MSESEKAGTPRSLTLGYRCTVDKHFRERNPKRAISESNLSQFTFVSLFLMNSGQVLLYRGVIVIRWLTVSWGVLYRTIPSDILAKRRGFASPGLYDGGGGRLYLVYGRSIKTSSCKTKLIRKHILVSIYKIRKIEQKSNARLIWLVAFCTSVEIDWLRLHSPGKYLGRIFYRNI